MSFSVGDTFLLHAPSTDRLHLFITLCEPFLDPLGDPLAVIAVPLTTPTVMTDKTVLLLPKDHPFIRYETAVSYNFMTRLAIAGLARLEQDNINKYEGKTFVRCEPLRGDVLNRVIAGALTSELSPRGVKRKLIEILSGAQKS